jgi:deoxycytidylate deaminase
VRPCLKQLARCIVAFPTGQQFSATNECDVDGLATCPRVILASPTGEGYELCRPIHAEANVAAQIPDGLEGGIARLYGHTWFCGPCQWALTAKGVRTLVITGHSVDDRT